ncbi:MAG: hypothetical protein RIA62_06460 [Cyclobacteriaceae bacterium]
MKSIVATTITRRIVPVLWILTLITSSLKAQDASKNDELIIGTWALDYNLSISQADIAGKAHYDTINYERKSRIIDSFSQRKIAFQEDGTYTLVINAGYQVNGTWELQSDNKTLYIVLDGRKIEQRIEEISKTSMVLYLGGDQSANQLFRKWYLNKVGS